MGYEPFISLSKKQRRWKYLDRTVEFEAVREGGALVSFITETERKALRPAGDRICFDYRAREEHLRDPDTLIRAARKLLEVAGRPDRPKLNRNDRIHYAGEPPSEEEEQKRLYASLEASLQTIIEVAEEATRNGRAVYYGVCD